MREISQGKEKDLISGDYTLAAILCGSALDLIAGDPHWLYHPVRLIGHLISDLEKGLRKLFPKTPSGERIAGGVLALAGGILPASVAALLLFAVCQISRTAGFVLEILLDYSLLAARSLYDESEKVRRELIKPDLPAARRAVSMIVGRDTQNLDEDGVTRACVETIAENTSDGVLAPLFYLMLGGPVLGWMYKSINTMDSMVGYQNDRYRFFGTAAAKTDDLANYIPSRISALLIIVSSALLGFDAKNAWRVWKRDRRNHKSPNSAQTESAVAGALNVRLAGDAYYFGKLVKKPYIGDENRKIEMKDIGRAQKLMITSSVLGLLLVCAGRALLYW